MTAQFHMPWTAVAIPVWLLAALMAPGPKALGEDPGKDGEPIYTVAKYNPERDPAQDLAATIKQAKAAGKRIILEIGGDW